MMSESQGPFTRLKSVIMIQFKDFKALWPQNQASFVPKSRSPPFPIIPSFNTLYVVYVRSASFVVKNEEGLKEIV